MTRASNKLRKQIESAVILRLERWIGRSAERALAVERLLVAFMATKPKGKGE